MPKSKREKNFYEVEEILDKKYVDSKPYYLIKWKGYDRKDSTWESAKNLSTIQEYIEEFQVELSNHNSKEKETSKEKSKRPALNKLKEDKILIKNEDSETDDSKSESNEVAERKRSKRNNRREVLREQQIEEEEEQEENESAENNEQENEEEEEQVVEGQKEGKNRFVQKKNRINLTFPEGKPRNSQNQRSYESQISDDKKLLFSENSAAERNDSKPSKRQLKLAKLKYKKDKNGKGSPSTISLSNQEKLQRHRVDKQSKSPIALRNKPRKTVIQLDKNETSPSRIYNQREIKEILSESRKIKSVEGEVKRVRFLENVSSELNDYLVEYNNGTLKIFNTFDLVITHPFEYINYLESKIKKDFIH